MTVKLRGLVYVGVALLAASLVSPPVLAAPTSADDSCAGAAWMDPSRSPDQRADLVLAQMTLDEKVAETHAISDATHAREVPGNPRLCIPRLLLNNGPAGVGSGGVTQPQTTALPAPLAVAASFDPSVAQAYGAVEGRETRAVGRNDMEGPNVNIARTPLNGRTFEAYGEDPYLAGQIAAANVEGIQAQGVIATVKHYLANNQETDRDTVNELIDDRTIHEIYLPAFETAVKQGQAGSVMCSKNLINDSHGCEQQALLQGVLKDDWGFDGFVVSDFTSCHSTVRCATGGMDLELPSATYFGAALKAAVQSGEVSAANLDDHVHRILATMFRLGLFDRPQGTVTPIDVAGDGATARSAAEAGTVLLKNSDDVLPLGTDRSVAVIGPSAATAMTGGGGSAGVAPLYSVSPLDAITRRGGTVNYAQGMGPVDLGPQPALPSYTVTPENASPDQHGFTARYYDNTTWSGTPVLTRVDQNVEMDPSGGIPAPGLPSDGWSVRWSGTFTAPVTGDYAFHLTNHARAGLYLDGTRVINSGGGFPGVTASTTVHLEAGTQHTIRVDWAKANGQAMIELSWTPPAGTPNVGIEQAVQAAQRSDVAVVFASNKDTEAIDRTDLGLPGYQDQLIEAVAAANPHTVVVLDTGGPVLMPWLDDVAGVLEAWYPGEEDGNAAADVLFGDVDPAGRLPITFPKSLADTPASTPAQYPGINGVARYSEGVFVGYRHYDAAGTQPLFPFGYGLSYTNFRLAGLQTSPPGGTSNGHVEVAVDVTNTGHRSGSQVVQLYVGDPSTSASPEPPHQLAGFAKVTLAPGQTRHVVLHVTPRSFARWNTTTNGWDVPDGTYRLFVGTSSADLPLTASLRLTGAKVAP
jgi:beta-glucosidase